ncbi:MAG: hypothetical protein LAO76_15095 [Acidobacteriia bacterium]|nr:hypothetical protein [Terriglobia bacterium]
MEANDLYLSEFELIFRRIGGAAFDALISACIRECRFTPTLADIRERAGLNQEKTQESEAQQAWLTVISYLGCYGSEGRGIYRGRHETTGELIMEYPPKLPPKITYAVRFAGGLKAIEQTPGSELHFRRDDFLAGYKAYESTKCFPLQLPEDLHHLLPELAMRQTTPSPEEWTKRRALNTRRELRTGTLTAGTQLRTALTEDQAKKKSQSESKKPYNFPPPLTDQQLAEKKWEAEARAQEYIAEQSK